MNMKNKRIAMSREINREQRWQIGIIKWQLRSFGITKWIISMKLEVKIRTIIIGLGESNRLNLREIKTIIGNDQEN